MADVFLSPEAEMDLERIGDYIARQSGSPKTAFNTIKKIKTRMVELEAFPMIGKPLSAVIAADTDYRFLGCGSYLTFYRYKNGNVFIDRILHGKQDYISILLGDIQE
jgi:plasmid stabilization system protein ParE